MTGCKTRRTTILSREGYLSCIWMLNQLVGDQFDLKVGDQEKLWAPHTCCVTCSNSLREWLSGRRPQMPFAIPMVWREPKDHSSDCYFCSVKVFGFSAKNKNSRPISYPDLQSARRPVKHSNDLPVPIPPACASTTLSDEEEEFNTEDNDPNFHFCDKEPHLLSQN